MEVTWAGADDLELVFAVTITDGEAALADSGALKAFEALKVCVDRQDRALSRPSTMSRSLAFGPPFHFAGPGHPPRPG